MRLMEEEIIKSIDYSQIKKDQRFLNAKLGVFCPTCKKLTFAKVEHDLDTGFNCDTCGPSDECVIEIICKECEQPVWVRDF